jgi:hypothetical protein
MVFDRRRNGLLPLHQGRMMTTTLNAPPRPITAPRPRSASRAAPVRQTSVFETRPELIVLGVFLRLIGSLLTLGLGLRLLAEGEPPVYGIAAPTLGYVLISVGLLGVYLGRAFFLADPLDRN